jgi:hypothetical protein
MSMKLITVCSDSHIELLENHLLPSLPPSLIPVVVKTNQRGNGIHGHYPEFIAAMREKMSVVLHYTKTEKAPFIYCDADIRFNPMLDPVPMLLTALEQNKLDIVCQRDGGEICAGFMLLDPSEKNANYLQAVLQYMDANPSKCDQLAFKELYRSNLYSDDAKPRIGLLDINGGFGNMNHLQPNVLWTKENDMLERHKDIVRRQFMWHANHTIGVENKMNMLDRFKMICEDKPQEASV